VWMTDVSGDALAVAQANLAGVGTRIAPRVRVAHGDWWAALPSSLRGRVDLAVANPPYVSINEMASLDPTVADWEPVGALVAGPDGLEEVRNILSGAAPWLAAGAAVVVEIAPHQASAATEAAFSAGFVSARVHRDLAGRDRVLVALP
jgi:release factor glutamine methyltransferase